MKHFYHVINEIESLNVKIYSYFVFSQAGGPPGGWDQSYPPPTFPGQQLLNDPMASMAMQYGQTIAGQGKQMVEEKVSNLF